MKSQIELLHGTGIPSDDLPTQKFTQADEDFLAVAEAIAFYEWDKVAKYIGLPPGTESISDNYDAILQRQGAWTLAYATRDQL